MSTFSIDTPTPAAAPSLQAQPVRVGVEGQAQEASLALTNVGNGTGFDMAPLEQLGKNLLEPVLKQQQEYAFYQGVQRAANKETAADIEAERPAWARAFGTSDAVRGARYHEQISDSAALERRIIESMPKTRSMPPEQFAEHVRQNVKALKTGDPTRDMILEGSALQFLPGAMKMHAAAHLDYNQKLAAAQNDQSVQQQIGTVETLTEYARQNPGTVPDDYIQGSLERMTSMLQVPEGVDIDAHMKRVGNGIVSALTQGQFDTYKYLKRTKLLDNLPVDIRDNIERSAQENARKFVQEKAPEGAVIAAFNITNDPKLDGPALLKAVDTLNKQVEVLTGIPGAKFIPDNQRDNLLQIREQWRDKAAGKAETANKSAAERAAKQEHERLEIERAAKIVSDPKASPGTGSVVLNALTKPQADVVRAGAWSAPAALAPEQRMAEYKRLSFVIGGEKGEVPDFVYSQVENAANSTKWTPELDVWAGSIAGMDKAFAAKLQGSTKNVDKLLKYVEIRKSVAAETAATGQKTTRTPQDMWDSAQLAVQNGKARDPLPKETESDIQSAIAYMNTNSWAGMRSSALLGKKVEIGMGALTPLARRAYLDNPGEYNSPETRHTAAVSRIHQDGGRVVGNVGFIKMNQDDPEWDDPKYFPGAKDSPAKKDLLAHGFREAFDKQAARNKFFKEENIVSITQGDVDGKVEFRAIYLWTDEKTGRTGTGSFTITQAEVQAGGDRLQAKLDKETLDTIKQNERREQGLDIYEGPRRGTLPRTVHPDLK